MNATLACAALVVLLTPAAVQVPSVPQEFEVASVKRNISESRPWLAPPVAGRFTATNIPLKLFIGAGWPLKVSGGPSWVYSDGYDVTAILPEGNRNADDFKLMMQNLLKERFGLKVHTETREARVYLLLPAKNGLRLPNADPEACLSGREVPATDPRPRCAGMNVTPESITNDRISMEWFTGVLAGVLGRPVVNKTGFTGSFKVHLEYAPLAPDADSTKPSLSEALEKQLGVRLDSQKGTEEILVIDHVDRPSEN